MTPSLKDFVIPRQYQILTWYFESSAYYLDYLPWSTCSATCLFVFFSDEIHNWEGISRLCEYGLSPQIFLRRNCVHLHVIIWQSIFIAVGARVCRSHFDYVYVWCFKMRYYYRWCSVMPLTSILTILTNRILKSVDSTGRLGSPTLGRSSAMYLVIYTKTPILRETDNH